MKTWIEVLLIVVAFFTISFLVMPEGVEPNEWGSETIKYLIGVLGFYTGWKKWEKKYKKEE